MISGEIELEAGFCADGAVTAASSFAFGTAGFSAGFTSSDAWTIVANRSSTQDMINFKVGFLFVNKITEMISQIKINLSMSFASHHILLYGLDELAEIPVFLSLLSIGHPVKLGFFLQLEVILVVHVIDFARAKSIEYGTAGLAGMGTIPVTATGSQGCYVDEAPSDTVFRSQDSKLAHPRIIDNQGAVPENDQFPADCRMPALAGSTYIFCFKPVLAEQLVDDRTLADSR